MVAVRVRDDDVIDVLGPVVLLKVLNDIATRVGVATINDVNEGVSVQLVTDTNRVTAASRSNLKKVYLVKVRR